MKLSAYLGKTRRIQIDIDGEALNVEYRPNVVTPVFLDSLEGLSNRESVHKQVCQAVQTWDLLDDSGQPVPITEEILRTLPTQFTVKVLNSIVTDMNGPGKEEKKD